MVMNTKPILVKYDKKQQAIRMRQAAKLADVKAGDAVLDVGCGNVELIDYLPKGVEYVGVDYYKTKPFVVKYDISKGLPPSLRKRKFKAVFLLEFIEHMENFRFILHQCKKVLVQGGVMIVSAPNPNRFHIDDHPDHIHSFTPLNMRNVARQLGMRVAHKTGTYIAIPVIHKHVPSRMLLGTDTIVYALRAERNK